MFKSLGHQLNCITIVQNSSFFIVQKGCKLLSEQYSWRLKVWPFAAAVLQIWFLSWLFDYSLPITYPCTATSCHFNLMSVYFFHFYVHLILHVCFFFPFQMSFFSHDTSFHLFCCLQLYHSRWTLQMLTSRKTFWIKSLSYYRLHWLAFSTINH